MMISDFIGKEGILRLFFFEFNSQHSAIKSRAKGFPINTLNVYCSTLTTEYVWCNHSWNVMRSHFRLSLVEAKQNNRKPRNTLEIGNKILFSSKQESALVMICRVDDLRFHHQALKRQQDAWEVWACISLVVLPCFMILFFFMLGLTFT